MTQLFAFAFAQETQRPLSMQGWVDTVRQHVAESVGQFFIDKYRGRAADAGHCTVATQLRKQGVPLEQALLILLGCEERFTEVRP